MAYKTTFRIHAVRPTERTAQVDFQGTKVNAIIPLLEIEMVDEAGHHGTINLRMHTPEDRQIGADQFREGELVTITFGE